MKVLRRKFISMSDYIKKITGILINLIVYLKLLEKKEKVKTNISRWKEIIIMMPEFKQMDTKRMIQIISERKSWFFKNISNIDKSLPKVIKRKSKKTQINKIRDDKENIITNTNEIQRVIEEYYEIYIPLN
jgi:hypothetical protein